MSTNSEQAQPDSPFETLRKFLEKEVGAAELAFSDIVLRPSDWAEFRFQTARWLCLREGTDKRAGEFSVPGVSSPLISAHVAPSFAEVA